MKRLFFALLALSITTGCFTRFRQANDLAAEGKFVEAANLFEQLHKESPNDPEVANLLARARYKAVDQWLGKARVSRLAGDTKASQESFAYGLTLRETWAVKIDGALESTVDDERDEAERVLNAKVKPLALKGEALSAEAVVAEHQFLLKHVELTTLRESLTRDATSSGVNTCAKLKPTALAGTPYWTHLVAKYCEHFAVEPPAQVALPDTAGQIRGNTQVSNLSDASTAILEGGLAERFYAGPWYSEKGPLTADLSVRGATSTRLNQNVVQLSADWVEQVPYVQEVVKEVTDTVPVTECRVENQSVSGGGTKQVMKTETINKQTKKYIKVNETRFRDVPRVFVYQALRVDQSLNYGVRAELVVAGQPAATAARDGSQTFTGFSHDVTFAPAKVSPRRADLPSTEGWNAARTDELLAGFVENQRSGWRARFCASNSYSLEESARCARAGHGLPEGAINALSVSLGADAALAPRLLWKDLPTKPANRK